MNNGQINKAFLGAVDKKADDMILTAIAKHYGTTKDEILQELIDNDAENILDYMTGAERTAAHVLYQRHGFKL